MRLFLSAPSFITAYRKSWLKLFIHSVMVGGIVCLTIAVIVLGWRIRIGQQTQAATSISHPADQTVSNSSRRLGNLSHWLSKTNTDLLAAKKPLVFSGNSLRRVPILMYHYIRINPDPTDTLGYGLSVTPEDFTQQMAYLAANGYQAMSVFQVMQLVQNGLALPKRPVVITFDDGYRDFYTDAYPILKQYGLHGETYVITSLVDTPRYVTWSMLHQMIDSGVVTVGSHTVDHPYLTSLSAVDQLKELQQSKRVLESKLGVTINDFCYPFGNYNQQVAQAVIQAGYADATTTKMGLYTSGNDVMALPRVRVEGGESLATFIARLQSPLPADELSAD